MANLYEVKLDSIKVNVKASVLRHYINDAREVENGWDTIGTKKFTRELLIIINQYNSNSLLEDLKTSIYNYFDYIGINGSLVRSKKLAELDDIMTKQILVKTNKTLPLDTIKQEIEAINDIISVDVEEIQPK